MHVVIVDDDADVRAGWLSPVCCCRRDCGHYAYLYRKEDLSIYYAVCDVGFRSRYIDLHTGCLASLAESQGWISHLLLAWEATN